MAGGGEVERELAADTSDDNTFTIVTRHLTNSSWNERGKLEVVAQRRLDSERWNKLRELVSLSCSDMVVVMIRVFSA